MLDDENRDLSILYLFWCEFNDGPKTLKVYKKRIMRKLKQYF